MRNMSSGEWHQFLLTGTRTAKAATVRPDGRPHLAPVWFVLDGDELIFCTSKQSVKGRDLARDGRTCLCVDDDRPPFASVLIEGSVTLSEDLEQMRHWATRIGERYMGPEHAQDYGARNAVPGGLLVRVNPRRIIAQAEIAA